MIRSVIVLILGIAVGAVALGAEAPLPSVFGESVDVRLVNIEVVVTDRQGQRVTGLGVEDFRLLVDGQEAEIHNFSEVREGAVVAPAEVGPESSRPTAAAEGRVGRKMLLFLDDYFSFAAPRNRAIESLRSQLETLGPGDEMAVVAFNGRRLDVLTPWTSSRADLEAALDEGTRRPSFGAFVRSQLANLRTGQEAGPAGSAATSAANGPGDELDLGPLLVPESRLSSEQRAVTQQIEGKLKLTMGAVRAAMRAFAEGSAGRKVLLLTAGGWPASVQEFIGADPLAMPEATLESGDRLFAPVIDTANLLGYTVYPIDLPKVSTLAIDVEATGPANPSRLVGAESNLEAPLRMIARATGGRAMLNSNADRALAEASADLGSYYWLGFSPARRFDDKRHNLKVELRRRDLEARFRRGFHDLSQKAEMEMSVESGLLLGVPAGAGALPVEVLGLESSGNKMKVTLLVAIPVDEITVIEQGDKYVAELELYIGAMDSRSNLSAVRDAEIRLANRKRPEAGRHVRYETTLKLWEEPHELFVTIRDRATGRILATRLQVP